MITRCSHDHVIPKYLVTSSSRRHVHVHAHARRRIMHTVLGGGQQSANGVP